MSSKHLLVVKVVEALVAIAGPGGLHENTLLVVLGDHGMTSEGEHGGGLPEETDTALLALSLRGLHRHRHGHRPQNAR